jgi:hypothetical protein
MKFEDRFVLSMAGGAILIVVIWAGLDLRIESLYQVLFSFAGLNCFRLMWYN